MIHIDVDTAVTVPVNIMPLIDDTDFITRETAIAYNQAGMDLVWNFVTSAGVVTQTAVTPTTGGDYDWTHVGDGMYKIEIPASGGASINNDTEGTGYFTGICTGVLAWRGPDICFRAAALNDALIDGGDVLDVSVIELGGVAQSLADLKDFADEGYDPATNKVQGVVLVDTTTTNTDMRGTDSAATAAALATAQLDLDAITDTDGVILGAAGVDLIWDEVLTGETHNVNSSSGKRLRALASVVVRDETAQGPGTGSNQIQLDASASAVDGAYDPSLITIVGGTGVGQSRTILEYDGTNKIATVDRNWKTNPDATSEFVITGNPGREHVNEGLAQGGTSNTITLNALASSSDDTYNGQLVFIRSGTGDDQGRLVIDYNGTTKVATIDGTWGTTPDSTSAYIMIPSSPVLLSTATQASIDAVETATVTDIPATLATVPADVWTTAGRALSDPAGFKKNTSGDITFVLRDASDGRTPIAGETVTAQRSIDGAAFGACANSVTEIGNGAYIITLAASDLNGDIVILRFTSSGSDDLLITIKTET